MSTRLKSDATEEISRKEEKRGAKSKEQQRARTVGGYLGFVLQPEQN